MTVKRAWANGGRPLIVAVLTFAASLALLVAVCIWVLAGILLKPGPYMPLRMVNPQHVETPIVAQGTTVTITGTKCNDSDEDISIIGNFHYRRVSGTTVLVDRVGAASGRVLKPGCLTATFDNVLPDGVTPGTWIIEGSNQASRGSETQVVAYYSDNFEVIP